MKIKFLRPVAGYAYWENDITDCLPDAKAASLVAAGQAVIIPDTEGTVNTLPANMPGRVQLFDNGLETIDDVRKAANSLTSLDGITKKTATDILKYLAQIEAPQP